jgi:hypothetical protein
MFDLSITAFTFNILLGLLLCSFIFIGQTWSVPIVNISSGYVLLSGLFIYHQNINIKSVPSKIPINFDLNRAMWAFAVIIFCLSSVVGVIHSLRAREFYRYFPAYEFAFYDYANMYRGLDGWTISLPIIIILMTVVEIILHGIASSYVWRIAKENLTPAIELQRPQRTAATVPIQAPMPSFGFRIPMPYPSVQETEYPTNANTHHPTLLPPPYIPSAPAQSIGRKQPTIRFWSLDEVQHWLKSNDLQVLQPIFIAQEIDGLALMALKESDLQGFTIPVGKLRRLFTLRDEIIGGGGTSLSS